ncbi:MAG: ParA family protein, partial [Desulfobacterales bacterium]
YDGMTSVGPVQAPYPTGGMISETVGEFSVYVLPQEAGFIQVTSPQITDGNMPVALPFNVTVFVPTTWSSEQLNYTVMMDGIVLDTGVQPAYGDVFAYNYDPRRLHERFPNLDTTLQNTFTPVSADAIRMTFVLSGVDELIPLQCEFYALEGLGQLLQTVKRIKQHLNPHLAIAGILLTMFDRRTNLSYQVAEDAEKYFKNLVYKTIIPRNIRLSEAPSFGKPILLYDATSTGAHSYFELAREIMAAHAADPVRS